MDGSLIVCKSSCQDALLSLKMYLKALSLTFLILAVSVPFSEMVPDLVAMIKIRQYSLVVFL